MHRNCIPAIWFLMFEDIWRSLWSVVARLLHRGDVLLGSAFFFVCYISMYLYVTTSQKGYKWFLLIFMISPSLLLVSCCIQFSFVTPQLTRGSKFKTSSGGREDWWVKFWNWPSMTIQWRLEWFSLIIHVRCARNARNVRRHNLEGDKRFEQLGGMGWLVRTAESSHVYKLEPKES